MTYLVPDIKILRSCEYVSSIIIDVSFQELTEALENAKNNNLSQSSNGCPRSNIFHLQQVGTGGDTLPNILTPKTIFAVRCDDKLNGTVD